MCIQLVEALKNGGAKSKRRLLKGGGAPSDVEGVGGAEVASEGIGAVETYPGDAGGSH
ncbi:hypothetical protein A2U01_0105961, partial [Trifolium medium]|nr:hypothetical protein [Trifolium medium]